MIVLHAYGAGIATMYRVETNDRSAMIQKWSDDV
jgi:hypothetical protein